MTTERSDGDALTTETEAPPPSKEWIEMWAKKFDFSKDKTQWPG